MFGASGVANKVDMWVEAGQYLTPGECLETKTDSKKFGAVARS